MKRIIFLLLLTVFVAFVALTFGLKNVCLILLALCLVLLFFIRFVVVEEGTARAITFFGQFQKIIFEWQGHFMDRDWTIRKNDEDESFKKRRSTGRIIGGLYFYFWPFQKIHRYPHRWYDIRLRPEGRMEIEFHEFQEKELFDHILLRPAVYANKVFNAETVSPERMPVDILFLITLRIDNPYKFLFIAPPTPVEDVLSRISAVCRSMVGNSKYDDLLKLKGESLWSKNKKSDSLLKGVKLIEETLGKWGMELADKGIEIYEIDMEEEYQKMGAAQKSEEMKAAGRAEEITGTMISSLSRLTGKSSTDLQAEFNDDPEKFAQKYEKTMSDIMTKLSMESRSYLRIETPGVGGDALGGLLSLIGATKRMPIGKGVSSEISEASDHSTPQKTKGEINRDLKKITEKIKKEKGYD